MKKLFILFVILMLTLPIASANTNVSLDNLTFSIPDGYGEVEIAESTNTTFPSLFILDNLFDTNGENIANNELLFQNNEGKIISIDVTTYQDNITLDNLSDINDVNKTINGKEGLYSSDDDFNYFVYIENGNQAVQITIENATFFDEII